MKKIIFKAFALAVCSLCAFSACTHGSSDSQSGGGQNGPRLDTKYNERGDYAGGTHIFNVRERDSWLIKDGKTDYAIVVSSSAEKSETAAAKEFSELFAEATGIRLQTLKISDLRYSASAKYISFGENSFADGSGVKTTSAVKGNGYVIRTAGNSVFVKGGQAIGTLFGAYELLNQMFDYMCYGTDCYYISRGVRDLRLCDYDILDNPDIDQRLANYGVIYTDAELAHKLRFQTQYGEVYMNPGRAFHNTLEYLPPAKYPAHADYWYSAAGNQLCYTARGNAEEYAAMVDAMVEEVKPYIVAEPEKRVISISQEDNYAWCECGECTKLKEKYGGADSAGNIIFINDVAEKIEAWLNKEHPGREVTIATFAYYKSELPPATRGTDGKWRPIDEKVVARDNVTILYAPLGLMEFNHSIEDDENIAVRNILDGWEVCCSHIAVWNYQTHFTSYFMPYNTFSACQEQYKKYIDLGASWIFDQGQQNNGNSTGFSMLKIYLNSQWGWDVNRDYNTLVDNFFENYFGKKDGAMRRLYEELRTWLVHLDAEGLGGRCSETADSSEYWPQQLVNRWLSYIDEAYAEIEPLKDVQPETYKMLAKHVRLESMMVRYMAIRYYPGAYSTEVQEAMKREFAADCTELNITHVREMADISTLIGKW